jgi:hypothetical protein
MGTDSSSNVLDRQRDYLLPGRNALETSIELAESWTRKGKPFMRMEAVKQILETLDKNQVN